MRNTTRQVGTVFGVLAGGALAAASGAIPASAQGTASLPPTWHVHDCVAAPCVLPHAPVAFFPAILHETLSAYLTDPAQCPDATDKALLGGGQPPTTDGVQTNQPLREGVCMTGATVIHLRSVAPNQPAPSGWTLQGTSGGYSTYFTLTSR